MLLHEGKLDDSVIDQTGLLGADEQMQQQIRRPLERGAASEADQMLIDELLLARGDWLLLIFTRIVAARLTLRSLSCLFRAP
jgi:hypothetical protein